jgi:hypothetical protein
VLPDETRDRTPSAEPFIIRDSQCHCSDRLVGGSLFEYRTSRTHAVRKESGQ